MIYLVKTFIVEKYRQVNQPSQALLNDSRLTFQRNGSTFSRFLGVLPIYQRGVAQSGLAHLLWEQGVPSSNLGAPTTHNPLGSSIQAGFVFIGSTALLLQYPV